MDERIKKTTRMYNKCAKDYFEASFTDDSMVRSCEYFMLNMAGQRILDAGCGSGRDTKYFCEKGFDCRGVDLSEKIIALARENVPQGRFEVMDMSKLEYEDGFFDGVWACASLVHIPISQRCAVISEFHRVLSPKGVLFLSVKEGIGEKMVPYHKTEERLHAFFSQEDLTCLLRDCDFSILKITKRYTVHNWLNVFARKNEL